MSTVTEWEAGTDSLPEIPSPRGDRLDDIEHKHALVIRLLEDAGADALLLEKPGSIAWFTSGGDFERGASGGCVASLFVTADARVVITSDVASPELFASQVPELGFQLKQRAWTEPRRKLISDLCRGRKVASDTACGRTVDVSSELQALRLEHSPLDRERLRALSQMVVHAVEATARGCKQGQTEAELAGEITHRLVKRRIRPVAVQVHADGIQSALRHRQFSNTPLESFCVLSAVGSRWGITAAATRTVCFGDVPDALRDDFEHALMLLATAVRFTQAGWKMAESWKRVARIYEKFGRRHEWRLAEQGCLLGADYCEPLIRPGLPHRLASGSAAYWTPSVGLAMTGDTALAGANAGTIITSSELWPTSTVEVKGVAMRCPTILKRAEK